jgi:hypothetical protein
MNWFNSLTAWLRPGRSKPRLLGGPVPVPRLQRIRVNSKIPRFSGAATESEPSIAANAPQVSRLSLAFTPAQPVSDLRRFAGRAGLLEQMIRTIEDRRMHVVVHGDRGIGKTSLLHILTLLAREARYLVRYTSCSEDSEFDEVFRAAAEGIPILYHRDYDPTSPEAEKGLTLADTLGNRPLTPTSLSEAFAKLAGTRILLILDEFDRASSPTFRKNIAELIKNLSDRSARVQIVIGGVAPNLAELIEYIPSIRRNILGIPVGPMADEELLQIVANAEAIAKFSFDTNAQAALLAAGNGSPYQVNLIGQIAARGALTRSSNDITADDVRVAVTQVEGELRSRLSPPALKQLAALQTSLSADMLRGIGRHSQHSFGSLLPHQNEAVTSALRKTGDESWWNEAGEFRFCDDSIPVILWLSDPGHSREVRAIAS